MAGIQKPGQADAAATDWPALAGRLAALGSIAGEAAHRFNNLRAVIEGTIELFAADPSGSRVRSRLERIKEAATGAQALAVALVGLARSDPASETRLDLGAWLLAERPSLTALLAAGHGLTIDVPGTPVSFTCNSEQLRAALTALVLNAAAALGATGHLGIRLEARQAANEILLTVTDDGAGMAPAVAVRAREPFFTTRPPAAGLGLTVAEAFVGLHSGWLELSTASGQGTRVSLRLAGTDAATP